MITKTTTDIKAKQGASPLFEALNRSIREGSYLPGQRLAPLRELAREFNISFGTVRSTMTRLEKLGLVETKQGSGTYVTYRNPDRENEMRTRPVYLMVDTEGHVFNRLSADLIGHLQDVQIPVIKGSWWKEQPLEQFKKIIPMLQSYRPRAVVVQWVYPGLDDAIRQMVGKDTRIISTLRDTPILPQGWHSVDTDYEAIGRLMGEHLIKQGHKRIGLVTHRRYFLPEWPHTRHKRNIRETHLILGIGYALREAGIRDGLTVHYTPFGLDFLGEENIAQLTQWLKEPNRPTAVVGLDFRMVALKRALDRMGVRIPTDMAIIGIGNTPWAESCDFTSVSLQEDMIAHHIAEIIKAPDNQLLGATRHMKIPPTLVFRASCPRGQESETVL